MILLLYQENTLYGIHTWYTSKDTALLFCFNARIAYHWYTMSQVSGMIMNCCGLLLYQV